MNSAASYTGEKSVGRSAVINPLENIRRYTARKILYPIKFKLSLSPVTNIKE
jgi:hypothetical protein